MIENKNYHHEAMPLIAVALENCDTIEDRVREDPNRSAGELPESAGEFVEQVKPKLVSVQQYGKDNLRVSLAQYNMVVGIAGGLEKWLSNV